MKKTSERWYDSNGKWMRDLDKACRARPPFGPEATEQDIYYDSCAYDNPDDLPWSDRTDDREAEL